MLCVLVSMGTSSHKSQLTRAISTDLVDDHSYSSKSLSISSSAMGKNYDVLIIGMSADSHATTRQRALDCGVDFFLQKPFTIDKLARILMEAAGDCSDNRKAEVSSLIINVQCSMCLCVYPVYITHDIK